MKKEEEKGTRSIARKCWEQMRKKIIKERGRSKWEEERIRFSEDGGMEMEEVEK